MSVTAPAGFTAAGVAAGIKASGKPDLALVVNTGPQATAAGVFTTNRVQAAPVRWTKQQLKNGTLRAVVLNSGGANACTGPAGYADTVTTAERAAARLNLPVSEVGVCSTGLIGQRLPMDSVISGVDTACAALADDQGEHAAKAIMTTDTVAKTAVATADGFTVGGMAKGAGMLAPSLATMLVVLTTDAAAEPSTVDKALRDATYRTFERVDSDGCLSTNDTVLLLASGASGRTPSVDELTTAVTAVCADLAKQILQDAEGATKEVAIVVDNAATEDDALTVGRAVARNNLLKCALFGNDPNWGRVLAAIGTTDAAFDPDRLDVAMNGVWVCKSGAEGEPRDTVDLTQREVEITIDLHAGPATATVYTNDLSKAYVHENSAYSS